MLVLSRNPSFLIKSAVERRPEHLCGFSYPQNKGEEVQEILLQKLGVVLLELVAHPSCLQMGCPLFLRFQVILCFPQLVVCFQGLLGPLYLLAVLDPQSLAVSERAV